MTDPYRRRAIIRGQIGPTGPIGQPMQNPLGDIDIDMSEETALYVGVLEGQLAAYAINEVKYRVLLELITGESWYSTKVDVDTNALGDVAVQALTRRGMDGTTARTLVNKRISFGVDEERPVQPRPDFEHETGSMADRFARWKQRQGRVRRPAGPLTEPIESEVISEIPPEIPSGTTILESEPKIWSTDPLPQPGADQTLGPILAKEDAKPVEPQEDSKSEES